MSGWSGNDVFLAGAGALVIGCLVVACVRALRAQRQSALAQGIEPGHIVARLWTIVRVPIAFVVAPLAVPMILAVPVILGLIVAPQSGPNPALLMTIGFSPLVAYGGTILFGIPLYLILRAQRLTDFRFAPLAGGAVGLITMILPLMATAGSGRGQSMMNNPAWTATFALCALSGAAVGTVLWLIARPDRQTQ